MATARDVAKLAGCSNAVVSYVFNNGPRAVSPETRDRVLRAAAMLSYKPNSIARTLSGGRSKSIGLIVPDITNPFFAEFAQALELESGDRDHLLLIGDSAMEESRETRLIDTFVDRRIDSLVLASVRAHVDLGSLRELGIPVVALHHLDKRDDASTLVIDYEGAAYAATRHLAEQGYRKVGILNGPSGSVAGAERHAGFTRAAREFGLQTSARDAPLTRSDAHDAILDWWNTYIRPEALFVTCDEQAIGVLSAAHRLHLRVPHDLAIISVDGTDAGKFTVPSLSSIRQPIQSMASEAVEILVGRQVDDPVVHRVFEFDLVLRESSTAR